MGRYEPGWDPYSRRFRRLIGRERNVRLLAGAGLAAGAYWLLNRAVEEDTLPTPKFEDLSLSYYNGGGITGDVVKESVLNGGAKTGSPKELLLHYRIEGAYNPYVRFTATSYNNGEKVGENKRTVRAAAGRNDIERYTSAQLAYHSGATRVQFTVEIISSDSGSKSRTHTFEYRVAGGS